MCRLILSSAPSLGFSVSSFARFALCARRVDLFTRCQSNPSGGLLKLVTHSLLHSLLNNMIVVLYKEYSVNLHSSVQLPMLPTLQRVWTRLVSRNTTTIDRSNKKVHVIKNDNKAVSHKINKDHKSKTNYQRMIDNLKLTF